MFYCLLMDVMMVNKNIKCISYITNGFEKGQDGGTKNLTKILSRKLHIKPSHSYVLLSVDSDRGNDGEEVLQISKQYSLWF